MPLLFDNTNAQNSIQPDHPDAPPTEPSVSVQKDKPSVSSVPQPIGPQPQKVEDDPPVTEPAVATPDDRNLVPPETKGKTELFGAYVTRPKSFYFATQERNEHVILYLRQHPITQFGWIFLIFLLLLFTPFVIQALSVFVPITLPAEYKIVLFLFWFLIIAAVIFTKYLLWYYNINIVTNKRIIDIDVPYLLSQEVNSALITQVEEVTYQRIGLMSAIFGYGDVFVQTAGANANIEFLKVPNPKRVVQTILYLKDQLQTK